MIITAAIALCFAVQTKADEGMWMLPLLEKIKHSQTSVQG